MSLTTNQGLIVPDPGDNANVPASVTELLSGGVTPSAGMENRLVQRFISSTDRASRRPSPNEGELSYLIDTNAYEYYNGSAWVNIAKGYVTDLTRVVTSASVTTTETVIDFVTFTAVTGAFYKLSWYGNARSSVANDVALVRFRYQAGPTLTTAGTQFYITQISFPTVIASNGPSFAFAKVISGIAAGQTSIGVSIVRSSGSGTITSIGSGTWEVSTLLESV